MMTNNTCDIEKDIPVGRQTLPAKLGREKARNAYHALVVAWLAAIMVLVGAFFTGGLIVMPFMLLAVIPLLKALFANPLNSHSRIGAMAQICSLNIALGAFLRCSDSCQFRSLFYAVKKITRKSSKALYCIKHRSIYCLCMSCPKYVATQPFYSASINSRYRRIQLAQNERVRFARRRAALDVHARRICDRYARYVSLPCHRIHTTLHRYTADYETLP